MLDEVFKAFEAEIPSGHALVVIKLDIELAFDLLLLRLCKFGYGQLDAP